MLSIIKCATLSFADTSSRKVQNLMKSVLVKQTSTNPLVSLPRESLDETDANMQNLPPEEALKLSRGERAGDAPLLRIGT